MSDNKRPAPWGAGNGHKGKKPRPSDRIQPQADKNDMNYHLAIDFVEFLKCLENPTGSAEFENINDKLAEVLPLLTAGNLTRVIAALRSPYAIIQSGTGTGKTTQIPKLALWLLNTEESMEKRLQMGQSIVMTTPSEQAATSAAKRLCIETGTQAQTDESVGLCLQCRDMDKTEHHIQVTTETVLLQKLVQLGVQKTIEKYPVIILDEAHERSLSLDFLLACLAPRVQAKTFKLIVMSATLDVDSFKQAAVTQPAVCVIETPCRFRVEYATSQHFVEPIYDRLMKPLETKRGRAALAFLPNQKAIARVKTELSRKKTSPNLSIREFHEGVPVEDQDNITQDGNKSRLILATDLAESGITFEMVQIVYDSGLCLQESYHPWLRSREWQVQAVSQSSAKQRAGRAGRDRDIQDAVCIRGYERSAFERMSKFNSDPISRSDLAWHVLAMCRLGAAGAVRSLKFIKSPPKDLLNDAFRRLLELNLLTDEGVANEVGNRVLELGCEVPFGLALDWADRAGYAAQVLPTVVCMMMDRGDGIMTYMSRQFRERSDQDEVTLSIMLYKSEG